MRSDYPIYKKRSDLQQERRPHGGGGGAAEEKKEQVDDVVAEEKVEEQQIVDSAESDVSAYESTASCSDSEEAPPLAHKKALRNKT